MAQLVHELLAQRGFATPATADNIDPCPIVERQRIEPSGAIYVLVGRVIQAMT